MLSKENQILSDIYNQYLQTGNRECFLDFSNLNKSEKRETLDTLDLLEDYGYIQHTSASLGFCSYKITASGIDFVKNGFQKTISSPLVQGDNCVFINGSQNTVSGNYNKISVDIESSNLPENTKQLIESLLYELKNPHLTPAKRSDKIKNFLIEISSGTISDVASAGIAALLSSLFTHIPF